MTPSVNPFSGIAAAALLALAAAPSGASVLTFDIAGIANYAAMDPAYGDRVTATTNGPYGYGIGAEGPTGNIVVSYSNVNFQTSAGDLTNTAADFTGPELMTIRFDADAGFVVNLLGFDLATGSTTTIDGFRILDGDSNVLATVSDIAVPGATHSSFSFLGISAPSLVIELNNLRTLVNGSPAVVVLDNIVFSQSTEGATPAEDVPEPSSLALLSAALLGAAGALRRRLA